MIVADALVVLACVLLACYMGYLARIESEIGKRPMILSLDEIAVEMEKLQNLLNDYGMPDREVRLDADKHLAELINDVRETAAAEKATRPAVTITTKTASGAVSRPMPAETITTGK